MRWSLPAAIALSLLSGAADAAPHPSARSAARSAKPTVDDGDFWRDLLEPHAAQVHALVERAELALNAATTIDVEGSGDVARQYRRLDDAYGMLRYAQTLSPEHPDVLRLLGLTADALGKPREAIDALEHAARLDPPERVHADVADRLGVIYLRLDRPDDAVRWLRAAVTSRGPGDHTAPTVHLAAALAARGELTGAIELLLDAQPRLGGPVTEDRALTGFALAVYYDRDEQPGAAFTVLDRLQGALQQEASAFIERGLRGAGFAPAEDEYYYLAMLDEANGNYIAARAQWAMYAAVPSAPWRRRALEHITAIDTQRRLDPPATALPTQPSPRPPVRR